jgi:hypothetical protein
MALHFGVTGIWKIEFMVSEILDRVRIMSNSRAMYLSPGGLFSSQWKGMARSPAVELC